MSDPTLSISFFLSALSFCCLLLASYWLYQSDFVGWYRELPVIDQCAVVVAFSLFGLGFAATLREACADTAVRWTARGIGVVGIGVLIAFSVRVSIKADNLQSQIASRDTTNATGIALANRGTQDRSLRDDASASITTKSGHVITVSHRPVSNGDRHTGLTWDGIRYMDGRIRAETGDGAGGLPVLPGGVSADSGSKSTLSEF
jgi:hypothetical protein